MAHTFNPTAILLACLVLRTALGDAPTTAPSDAPEVTVLLIDPLEKDFFAKQIIFDGIAIKSAAVVSDAALIEAHRRLSIQLGRIPDVRARLAKAGAALHIIGKDQVPSDLPELRRYKGKPYDGDQTIDQRTRGVGGLLSSCGEENLLKLQNDRYRGRDICVHEFAHCIYTHGLPEGVRRKFDEQRKASLAKGLWVNAYAGSNRDEFFAELTMWYLGTRGDLGMKPPKPANGPEGLKAYDPDAYALFDDFYSGRIDTTRQRNR